MSSRPSEESTTGKTASERRRHERFRVVGATASSPSIDFTVVELSPFGMSIETGQPLQVGDVYELKIRHRQATIEAEGTVRWCRLHQISSEDEANSSAYVYRVGFALRPSGDQGLFRGEGALRPSVSTPADVEDEAELGASPEDQLEAAGKVIDDQLLSVVYQPIFNLKAGSVYAYEALARCPSRQFGGLPELFRAAARLGRVGELGRLHRIQAVAQAPPTILFINVSPYEFDHGWLIRPDDAIFLHRQKIVLEITESVPISRFAQCRNVLAELRKKGIGVAIDDLGAGFSNLKYLADLAPEYVKIDRALISGVGRSPRSYALLEAVVAMCKRLKATVIAEGIETREELVAVNQAGIDFCQGYLLGRPSLPAPEDSWPAFI